MSFLERSGAKIHYELWKPTGEGRGFVTLIGGHTRTAQDFRMMARHLTQLGYSVVSLDNRGAGETQTSRSFTLEEMAEDIAAVWSALGWPESHLLGISLGGMIALTLVLHPRRTHRVRSLVLVSTTAARNAVTKDWPDENHQPSSKEIEDRLLSHFSPSFAEKQEFLLRAFIREMAKAFSNPERVRAAAAQRAAMRGFDVSAALASVTVPTLVIHGSEDRIIPVAAAEALSRAIPGAKLKTVEGAGHLLLAEAPRRLYDLAAEFFERN